MKNKKILLIIIITSIILLLGISINLIFNNNTKVLTKTQIIKEMSESTQVTELNNQITALNASHDEYAKNVQAYKTKIAEAITNQGVPTSADAKTEVIVDNIGKILQEKTIATATAAQILAGQTAWVNGSKITGTMVNRGTLNWTPTSPTTYNVPEGYYSGGTLNSEAAYNTGFSNGITTADNRANGNSVNYKTGYNNGYNQGFYDGLLTMAITSTNPVYVTSFGSWFVVGVKIPNNATKVYRSNEQDQLRVYDSSDFSSSNFILLNNGANIVSYRGKYIGLVKGNTGSVQMWFEYEQK